MLQQLAIVRRAGAVSAFALLAAVPAQAHFLWVVVGDEAPKAQLVFTENPAEATMADLLPKIAAKAWDASGQPVAFAQQEKTWAGPEGAPAAIAASQTWGLMDHGGGKPFLIEYYAKGGATLAQTATELKLPYELYAREEKGEIVATLKKGGQPAADTTVNVYLPTGKAAELKTDAQGEVRFAAAGGGRYGLRAKFVEAKSGESGGQAYDEVRHYTTLAFALPGPAAPAEAAPAAAH